MAFVSNLLANNFVANKIGSSIPLFRDDDDDEDDGLVSAGAVGASSHINKLGTANANAQSKKKARARRDSAPVVAEDEDPEEKGSWGDGGGGGQEGDDGIGGRGGGGGVGGIVADGCSYYGGLQQTVKAIRDEDFHGIAPAAPGDDDGDFCDATSTGDRGHDENLNEAESDSGEAVDDDDVMAGNVADEEETVTQGDIDWLIQEMENLQNNMEFLEVWRKGGELGLAPIGVLL